MKTREKAFRLIVLALTLTTGTIFAQKSLEPKAGRGIEFVDVGILRLLYPRQRIERKAQAHRRIAPADVKLAENRLAMFRVKRRYGRAIWMGPKRCSICAG